LDVACDIATIFFNDGFLGLLRIMKVLQLPISVELHNYCLTIDEHRVKAANRSSSKFEKDARHDLKKLASSYFEFFMQ